MDVPDYPKNLLVILAALIAGALVAVGAGYLLALGYLSALR